MALMQARTAFGVLGLATALAGVVGCSPRRAGERSAPHAVSALTCPADVGDLELKSGGDGAPACVYAGEGGSQVTLRLVALDGAPPAQALAPIESQLHSEIPPAPIHGPPAAAAASGDDERVDLDLPGLHIHSHGNGAADVDAAGLHVRAHDHQNGHDDATVTLGGGKSPGVVINAQEDGAEIRVREGGPGVRMSFVLASDKPGPHGWRTAGYEARGPEGGPLAVAVVLSQTKDADDLRHDVRSLLRRNVGG